MRAHTTLLHSSVTGIVIPLQLHNSAATHHAHSTSHMQPSATGPCLPCHMLQLHTAGARVCPHVTPPITQHNPPFLTLRHTFQRPTPTELRTKDLHTLPHFSTITLFNNHTFQSNVHTFPTELRIKDFKVRQACEDLALAAKPKEPGGSQLAVIVKYPSSAQLNSSSVLSNLVEIPVGSCVLHCPL